jgi:hypothetical protein
MTPGHENLVEHCRGKRKENGSNQFDPDFDSDFEPDENKQ